MEIATNDSTAVQTRVMAFEGRERKLLPLFYSSEESEPGLLCKKTSRLFNSGSEEGKGWSLVMHFFLMEKQAADGLGGTFLCALLSSSFETAGAES